MLCVRCAFMFVINALQYYLGKWIKRKSDKSDESKQRTILYVRAFKSAFINCDIPRGLNIIANHEFSCSLREDNIAK